MSIKSLKKNLIDSDMIKLKIGGETGYNPYTGEEGRYVKLEEFLNGQTSKPIVYYNDSISVAVNSLIEQGYGRVEIPAKGQTPLCYISIRLTEEGEAIVNLETFGYRAPMRNARYYSLLGETNWQVGDIIYNTDYKKTRCLGWICTEEGQYDSKWERFGDLDISKDKTLFQIIEYPNDLPSASLENLGKFVLYSDGEYNQYHMWYCTRYFKQTESGKYQLNYKWINTDENESLIKRAELVYQYEGWQVERIEDKEIIDGNGTYTEEYPKVFAIYGIVPKLSEDDRMGLDPTDIQTIKIGRDRYKLKYYDKEFVYNGDLNEGLPILIYLDTEAKEGYLPYEKPRRPELTLVEYLPQADYSMLGKRVLYKNEGVDEYPCLYYCTQVENEYGGIEFRWVKPRETNLSSHVMEIEFDNDNWKIVKIGEIPVDSENKYLLKVSNTLILTGRVPSNSVDNQKIKINDKELLIRYLNGTNIKANEIIVNSIISIQVNLRLNLVTISSTPQPIEFDENKILTKLATLVTGTNGRWKIEKIGEIEIEGSYDLAWKDRLPNKLEMIVQVSSDSVNNQMVEIGAKDYILNYISGVPVAEGDLKRGAIISIIGDLNDNRLYIPTFPSTQAQQQADYTEVNNRIDLEIQNRENLGSELSGFKMKTEENFSITNNKITGLRGEINSIVAEEFAKKESPTLTGKPMAPTATEGDSTSQIANTEYVMRAIANLVDSSPESLNTLSELSSALNNDRNFAMTITGEIGKKLDKTGGVVTGTLILINDSTVLANQYNNPALVIGGIYEGEHLEIGRNQIQSKVSNKAVTELKINEGGGLVIIGEGGLRIMGNVEIMGDVIVKGKIESEVEMKAPTFNGTATSAVVAYNVPTSDMGGNIWLSEND